ncbi:class I SAM-dependent methyltransferase [Oceanicoccus sagamiensis]|uniref:Methyltransferase type 11 domain-containing protein n=1 Tax=Oceanicoccus sagamiensis TaxID=716816 RepID=A0A1X9NFN8_9GAMM|nr:class I SAM-dependent methyltransferase [Oceanicoccus sagamiensis]ARN75854.1 hypothetical protein BST96_18145 [Oceanicoccus sagamiensis]
MKDFLNRFKRQPDTEQLLPLLESWFDGEAGQLMLQRQREHIDEALASSFGYHLLQLSVDSRVQLFEHCRVQNKYPCHPLGNGSARCDFEQLPFASESLDVVLLHHVQEYVSTPHALLREIQRVVIPHGHVIILGFNPWSPLGLYGQFARLLPHSIWQNHSISPRRIKDWLSLLGFETQSCHFGYHNPAVLERSDKLMLKRLLKQWPLGNFYMISAIKEEAGMTPIKPSWKKAAKPFAGLSPVKPGVTHSAAHKPVNKNKA